jgi:UDP-GlcNAc:undecaprenyl-phosphate GlcNAc-1-phosphate transferase
MIFWEQIIGENRPITWVLNFWPVVVSAFVSALAATWLCKKTAIRLGIVDRPDNLVKTHKEPVAYLGGVGMLVGLTVGILAGLYLIADLESDIPLKWLMGVLGGAAIACFVGVVDDIFDISPAKKIAGQILAATVLIIAGIKPSLHHFTNIINVRMSPDVENLLGIPVVVLFVLGATNSLNLLDGLDGLCAGVTAVITTGMLVLAIHLGTWAFSENGDPVRIIICLSLVGGVFGFLPFNRYPAKIFMGDAGSMLLGFAVAAMMILFAESTPRWWMASIVLMGLPGLDTATALLRRFINKRPVFASDRGHLYDQMIDRGISLKRTVQICYLLSALYAIVGVGLAVIPVRTRYAMPIWAVVMIASGVVVWRKGFLKMDGLRGAIRKKD